MLSLCRAPTNSSTVVHLLPLPHRSKADGVRLRWSQDAPQGPEGYESCWGLDNVLLVNAAHKAPLLEDNLDPPDTANWLFFPGATVKVHRWIWVGEGAGATPSPLRFNEVNRLCT